MSDINRTMSGVPWHVETIKKGEGDERRHKGRCVYYNNETHQCSKFIMLCIGSAHCDYYKERPIKAGEYQHRKNKGNHHNKDGNKLERKDLQMDFNGDNKTGDAKKEIKPNKIFYLGCRINHKKFGSGTIIAYKSSELIVDFDNGERHELGLKYCIENKLISCDDPSVTKAMDHAAMVYKEQNKPKAADNNRARKNNAINSNSSNKEVDPLFATYSISNTSSRSNGQQRTQKKRENIKRENKKDIKDSDCKTIDLNTTVYYPKEGTEISHKHKTVNTKVIISIRSRKTGNISHFKISSKYCSVCKEYYITKGIYDKIIKTGIPVCRLREQRSGTIQYAGKNKFDKYNTESLLKEYGYNVDARDNLPPVIRQDILKSLIDEGICDKDFIISHLEVFIYDHKNAERNKYAVQKWEDDLNFIKEYSTKKSVKESVNAKPKVKQKKPTKTIKQAATTSAAETGYNGLYQAYVVQKINGVPYNVMLGDNYKTRKEAYGIIEVYEKNFGKCINKVVEPAGLPIPTYEEPKKSIWQQIIDLIASF